MVKRVKLFGLRPAVCEGSHFTVLHSPEKFVRSLRASVVFSIFSSFQQSKNTCIRLFGESYKCECVSQCHVCPVTHWCPSLDFCTSNDPDKERTMANGWIVLNKRISMFFWLRNVQIFIHDSASSPILILSFYICNWIVPRCLLVDLLC